MLNHRQAENVEIFRKLHAGPRPLVLLNAWDPVSAALLASSGAPAIGTTSAGVAWAHGYPDGEQLPSEDLMTSAARICRTVSVPVTVDVERGYGGDSAEVAMRVEELAGLGVAGVNLEDGVDPAQGTLYPPEGLAERIRAIRKLLGPRMFVNARVDTYFAPEQRGRQRFDETVRRIRIYADAGCDCAFVPGLRSSDEIALLVREIPVPLNVYAGIPNLPSVPELGRLGVARVSVGCAPLQMLLGHAQRMARELLNEGTYQTLFSSSISSAEINAWFRRP